MPLTLPQLERHLFKAANILRGKMDAAEFFAVVSELFFEQPQALAAEAPAVYRELALLYQVHPLAW